MIDQATLDVDWPKIHGRNAEDPVEYTISFLGAWEVVPSVYVLVVARHGHLADVGVVTAGRAVSRGQR